MSKPLSERIKPYLLAIVAIIIIAFCVYSNVQVMVRNYKLSKLIEQKQAEIDKATDRNTRLKYLNKYFQTNSFLDMEARRRLSVKLPEETVYKVKSADYSSLSADNSFDYLDKIYVDQVSTTTTTKDSNALKWWRFLTGKG